MSAVTSINGNTAFPSFNFDLAAGFPVFNYEDGVVTGSTAPTIAFNNLEVDLGSFITDFAKPVVGKINDVIEPFRPVIDFLNADTKVFGKVGLTKDFDKNNDGKVSVIELAVKIAEAGGGSTQNLKYTQDANSTLNSDRINELTAQIVAKNSTINTITNNSFLLLEFDPLQAIADGDANGVAIYTKQVQIQNAIVQVGALAGGQETATIDALSNLVANSNSLDLSNDSQITELIEAVAPDFNNNTTEGAASIIAETNQRIDNIIADSGLSDTEKATEIVKVQQVAQDNITKDLQELGAGTKSVTEVVSENTGAELTEQIANAEIFDPTEIPELENSIPVTEADTATVNEAESVVINVLSNDSDPEDEPLEVTSVFSVNATVVINPDNQTVTYTPIDGFVGEDTFLYVAEDSSGNANSNVVIVTVNASDDSEPNVINGTRRNDNLNGTDLDDLIIGKNGNDIIRGNAGNDTIYGGCKNDTIDGGSGDDLLNGGIGNDILRGQAGIDTVDYSNVTFNGVFGKVAGLDINLDLNRALHSSNNKALAWTNDISTVENVIGTSRNDRFIGNSQDNIFDGQAQVGLSNRQTRFEALDGKNYRVTADVVEYQGSSSDFTFAGQADNLTASASEVGTDTLIDIEFIRFNEDDTVIATEDLF